MKNRLIFVVSTIGVNLLIAHIGHERQVDPLLTIGAIVGWTVINTIYFGRIMSALGLWR